jgi:hypothetical protein
MSTTVGHPAAGNPALRSAIRRLEPAPIPIRQDPAIRLAATIALKLIAGVSWQTERTGFR